jgi:hypothetical protein
MEDVLDTCREYISLTNRVGGVAVDDRVGILANEAPLVSATPWCRLKVVPGSINTFTIDGKDATATVAITPPPLLIAAAVVLALLVLAVVTHYYYLTFGASTRDTKDESPPRA